MEPKTKQTALFLLTGLVLTVAAIYSLPMQQAEACGKHGCGGGGGGNSYEKDCDCGGSLISVDDNNIGNNIGNVNTGDILSDNKVKALNGNNIGNLKDVNVLSKNYLKDVNVLSKNINNVELDEVLFSNDVIDGSGYIPVLNDNVQLGFSKLLSGHK